MNHANLGLVNMVENVIDDVFKHPSGENIADRALAFPVANPDLIPASHVFLSTNRNDFEYLWL